MAIKPGNATYGMSQGYEQVINIRHLPTKKVTLYPQNAEVVREIGDVKLMTGFNKINIVGITPTADMKTIRVQTAGSFTVTDIAVELVANPESFDNVYPIDLYNSSGDESDVDAERTTPEIESLETEIAELKDEGWDLQEIMDSNASSIKILGATLEKLGFEDLSMVSATLSVYQKQRAGFYTAITHAGTAKRKLDKKIRKLERRRDRLRDTHLRHKAMKKSYERTNFEEAIRAEMSERVGFWPTKVYRVMLTINSTVLSPEPIVTSLLLTYMVDGASWEPSYNLNISSIAEGTLVSQAEVQNTTSETWTNAEIIVSTNQAPSFVLPESVPTLQPWALILARNTNLSAMSSTYGLYPVRSHQETAKANISPVEIPSRSLYVSDANISDANHRNPDVDALRAQVPILLRSHRISKHLFHGEKIHEERPQPQHYEALKHKEPEQKSTKSAPVIPSQPASSSGDTGPVNKKDVDNDDHKNKASDADTSATSKPVFRVDHTSEPTPLLSTETVSSSADKSTTVTKEPTNIASTTNTKDMPNHNDKSDDSSGDDLKNENPEPFLRKLHGLRTIEPSSLKQRMSISIEQIEHVPLIHMVVPKLRQEAFLVALVKNTTATPILEGPAVLSLDGKLLGYTRMEHCSVGKSFEISLGIDSAMKVEYHVLNVLRSSDNFKPVQEQYHVAFTRAARLTNTRSTLAKVIVKEQVPVTRDKRLKIEVSSFESWQAGDDDSIPALTGLFNDQARGSNTRPIKSWQQRPGQVDEEGTITYVVLLEPGESARLLTVYTFSHPADGKPLESVSLSQSGSFVPL